MIRNSELEKKILDCGAGGDLPPLGLFHQYGFETHGVDIADDQIERADRFCENHGVELNIVKGDMRTLDFDDEFFSHVYSQNSIFHLSKADTAAAMTEMRRVLRSGGYIYVNFLSIEDQGFGEGEEAALGEWISMERGELTLHSYYSDNEPDVYFEDMEIEMKRKIITDFEGGTYKMVTLEYFAKKT
ncbi:MAG: class I SAM-dependent methyltransferase [Candidatus Thorarchaeota archaeon]